MQAAASGRKLSAVAALVLAGTLALSGCSLIGGQEADTEPLPETSQAAPTKAGATKAPPTLAEQMAGKVKTSLTKLGTTAKTPNRDQMLAAMVSAGAAKSKVEISIDKTPTGLAVDAMEAAVPVDKLCIIGQVRDGKAYVTTLPLLATGLCFVGNQH